MVTALSTASFAQQKTKVQNHTQEQSKTQYTCTMHPQVIKSKPGKCPKCGMDLVKKETKKKGLKM